MKRKKIKKPIDFITRCLSRGYSVEEVKKAFCEIRIKHQNDARLLSYFIGLQKSDNTKARKVAKDLCSALGLSMIWNKLPYLARCQRSTNPHIADLATELIQWVMRTKKSSEKIEKLDYFISSQRSRSKKVRKFASDIVQDMEARYFKPYLETLESYCYDKNLHVRKFTRKYAIRVLGQCGIKGEELKNHFDFIMNCTDKYSDSYTNSEARALSLTVMEEWPIDEVAKHIEYLHDCCAKLGGEASYKAMELVLRVISTMSYKQRKERLDFVLACWNNRGYHDYKVRPHSLSLALGIIRYFPKDELVGYISILIACQEVKKLQALSYRLALKFTNEILLEGESYIDNFIKNRSIHSNTLSEILALELKLKLMNDWGSKKLADNLWFVYACHSINNKRLQLKAKKLANKINPDDLKGKAKEIILFSTSASHDEYLVRNLVIGLQFRINPDEFLTCIKELLDDHCNPKKYSFLKEISFRIESSKFDIFKLFESDGYYNLGSLLALRKMKNWEASALAPFSDHIFSRRYCDHNKEVCALAEKLYGKIKTKEFSGLRISRARRMILVDL